MTRRSFSSDVMRDLYVEAIKQGFKPVEGRGSGHKYLMCSHPRCHHRVAFSITYNSRSYRAAMNLRGELLRHGFEVPGRKTAHTAPVLNSDERQAA